MALFAHSGIISDIDLVSGWWVGVKFCLASHPWAAKPAKYYWDACILGCMNVYFTVINTYRIGIIINANIMNFFCYLINCCCCSW